MKTESSVILYEYRYLAQLSYAWRISICSKAIDYVLNTRVSLPLNYNSGCSWISLARYTFIWWWLFWKLTLEFSLNRAMKIFGLKWLTLRCKIRFLNSFGVHALIWIAVKFKIVFRCRLRIVVNLWIWMCNSYLGCCLRFGWYSLNSWGPWGYCWFSWNDKRFRTYSCFGCSSCWGCTLSRWRLLFIFVFVFIWFVWFCPRRNSFFRFARFIKLKCPLLYTTVPTMEHLTYSFRLWLKAWVV